MIKLLKKINWVALLLAVLLGIYDGCTHAAFVGFVIGAYLIIVLISHKLFSKHISDNDNDTIAEGETHG